MVIDLETTITAWLASRRGSVTPQPYERLCSSARGVKGPSTTSAD